MITLTTKRKSPKVIILSGRVKMTSKGLTIKFRMANTSAKIIAVVIELIVTCGCNNFVSTYTATAVMSMLIMNLIIFFILKSY